MVLVDTSVWIRFLSNRAPYVAGLEDLLGRDEVSGHHLVYGELLIGDKGGRRPLLADYAQMHQAPGYRIARSSPSCESGGSTVAASAGWTCTCSRPHLSAASPYGRPTPALPRSRPSSGSAHG